MNPLRVLVVDDMDAFRMAASEWLEAEGHMTKVSKSGHEAAWLLAWEPFDLLLTDIIMPEGDGIELIRNVRKSRPEMKIVAVSAGSSYFGPDYYVSIAKKLGADAILLKPFDRQQLHDVVAGLYPALNGGALAN